MAAYRPYGYAAATPWEETADEFAICPTCGHESKAPRKDCGACWQRKAPMTVKPWTFQELAACKGMDLDGSFFSFKPEGIALAKKTCAGCPVKAECLDYAVANKIEFGVFGGLTDKERRPKRDRRR